MRGTVLAFPSQDRSHTCSVRDRPPQLEWLRPVCPPLFPACYGTPEWIGAGRVHINHLACICVSENILSTLYVYIYILFFIFYFFFIFFLSFYLFIFFFFIFFFVCLYMYHLFIDKLVELK
ncbi:hypothetical protein R3W88_029765 [Solanum pinnatisectum]|uniref:Uncharacterized protein n=1 Tax=Solanum pinnatisectum TaxID=50273 RepID=A0AAV9K836_9SOLN|nr:hypothetical protein R3W88_029765 [Solanum pinnatisectum]